MGMYFVPGFAADLGELELVDIVFGVHLENLGGGGASQNLDDLDKLVYVAVSLEQWMGYQHFCQHAAC